VDLWTFVCVSILLPDVERVNIIVSFVGQFSRLVGGYDIERLAIVERVLWELLRSIDLIRWRVNFVLELRPRQIKKDLLSLETESGKIRPRFDSFDLRCSQRNVLNVDWYV
jgi:hypothetical protein